MSVLVKGMEIPRNCWECEFNKSTLDRMDFCTLTNKQYNWGLSERPSDCPLVEVPEHGRLIDADKIRYHSGTWEKGFDWVMQSEIALMPTIIPADKDGEA